MALTKKDFILCLVYCLAGLFFIEAGVLSLYVAFAYHRLDGSAAAAISGVILTSLGGFLLVRAKRRFSRRD
jgi:uncharacterized membrane protein HdeD (DUF308 family)